MGSSAILTVGGVPFDSWKGDVPAEIAVLFNERERHVEELAASDEDDELREKGESGPARAVRYVTSLDCFRNRLEFFGFTLEMARGAFETGRIDALEECRRSISIWEGHAERHDKTAIQIIARERAKIELLTRTTPDQWLDALRDKFRNAEWMNSDRLPPVGVVPPPEIGGFDMRFPGSLDPRFQLRFVIEAVGSGDAVLDVSELVEGGYYDISDPISEYALDDLSATDRVVSHLIVLTEGSSDRFYLESVFRLFHPELSDYVSFMDFDGWNVPGGASFLENIVRSFAGSGIRDRILALFDNDTAGSLSVSRLSGQRLPRNIRVMRYPDVEIARNYPTLGPSGPAIMDVNGSAASVELYLGSDVIKAADGSYVPVQWKGYDPVLRRYQGEILDKRGCRKRFEEKLFVANQSQFEPNEACWAELKAIVDLIRTAFAPLDPKELINAASNQ
ncbi:MAG: HEPN/Toprim-associated domain-containing protein [Terracidiphilus sp.]